VLNTRTGARSVAFGDPRPQGGSLELRFMAANADVQQGDLLTTSGVDGVYPPGLPVARVAKVERRADSAFARIHCARWHWWMAPGMSWCCKPLSVQIPARPPGPMNTVAAAGKKGGKNDHAPGQQLLLPANPLFIWGSLIVALLVNMLPLGRGGAWMPDMPGAGAGVLERAPAFAGRHWCGFRLWPGHGCAPGRSAGPACPRLYRPELFCHHHSPPLVVVQVPSQAVQVLPLFVAGHAIELAVRLLAGGSFRAGRCCWRR
jgi:hypothetical protein